MSGVPLSPGSAHSSSSLGMAVPDLGTPVQPDGLSDLMQMEALFSQTMARAKAAIHLQDQREKVQQSAQEVFVPGRVCLFGEHSDWVGVMRRFNSNLQPGGCIVAGTDQGVFARCKPRMDGRLIFRSIRTDGSKTVLDVPMEIDTLRKMAEEGGFFSYVCGVACQVLQSYKVGGIQIDNYKTTLADGKGLSSSAAVCVLVARAFNQCYSLKITPRGEMELAYQGEISTPSRCGRMDQCVAFGRAPVKMTFDGDLVDAQPLRVAAPIHMVVVDLAAGKDTTAILQGLGRSFPFPESEQDRGLAELLGSYNATVLERSVAALETGDAQALGALMKESQKAFDRWAIPACPEQLTAPVLHNLLSHEPLQAFIWGGKGVGSQGDGTAQLVCRSKDDADKVIAQIATDFPKMDCMKLCLGGAAQGVEAVPSSAQEMSRQQHTLPRLHLSDPSAPVSPPHLHRGPPSSGESSSSSGSGRTDDGSLLPKDRTVVSGGTTTSAADVAVELLVQRFKELSGDGPGGGQRAQFLARIQEFIP